MATPTTRTLQGTVTSAGQAFGGLQVAATLQLIEHEHEYECHFTFDVGVPIPIDLTVRKHAGKCIETLHPLIVARPLTKIKFPHH